MSGRTARAVGADEAFEFIHGCIVANDFSARDLQTADAQRVQAESLGTFLPITPIVPTDKVGNPQNPSIRTIAKGKSMQDSATAG